MKRNKPVKRMLPVDLNSFVNVKTGELLGSTGAMVVRSEDTGLVMVDSSEYVMVDCRSFWNVCDLMMPADLGYLFKMVQMLGTAWNVVCGRNNTPHSAESLRAALGIKSESGFYSLMRRLEEIGVVYPVYKYVDEEKRRTYMVNPYLARRRKTISKIAISFCRDLRMRGDAT